MWIAPERHHLKRWTVPVLALATGLALAAVLTVRGRSHEGLVVAAVLAGYAALLAYRRNERALPASTGFGDGHRARVHLKAAAMTGDVLLLAIVGAVIVQSLRGADISPYGWLAALAGVTYTTCAIAGGTGW